MMDPNQPVIPPAATAPAPSAPRGFSSAMQPVPEGQDNDGQIASPEEQEQYNIFVGMCAMALYDQKLMPDTVALLRDGGNRIESIAAVASSIVIRVLEAAQAADQKIGGDVLIHAGREVVELVGELSERGSGEDIPEEELERAFYVAVDRFRTAAQRKGLYTPEDMAGDVAALQEADARGDFDGMTGGNPDAAPVAPVDPAAAPRGLDSALPPEQEIR